VLPHDVSDLASDVISHRLLLTFDALADGVNPRQIVDYVVSVVPVPQIATHPTPEQQQRGGAA
jgi:MoxR-like ATPase